MTDLPAKLPGHYASDAGRQLLLRYTDKRRDQLAGGHLSDIEAAHLIGALTREEPDFVGVQAVGRDRIRWLSAQLALREAELSGMTATARRVLALLERAVGHVEGWSDVAGTLAEVVSATDPALAFLGVPMDSLLSGWEAVDDVSAEGWGLFESDTYGWEIEADADAAEPLADTDAAIAHVRERAAAGSPTHQLALAIHLTQEAMNRAEAEAAGYTVDYADHLGAWRVTPPHNGLVTPALLQSETAAWSAAYRDLGEQSQ